jgi:nitroreductase
MSTTSIAATSSLSPPIPSDAALLAPILTPEQLVAVSQRRYATKKLDPSRTIPATQWAALEQALLYAASSSGLQPWRFLVLSDRTLREQLIPHSFGQRQIADSSHLVVFLARTDYAANDVERWIQRLSEVRGLPADQLQSQHQRLTDNLLHKPRPGFNAREAARSQVYIALGQFLTAAALLGIDTCAHGGFDPVAYDRLLGLADSGYHSVVLATAGYHAAADANAHAPKVRFPIDQVIQHRHTLGA